MGWFSEMWRRVLMLVRRDRFRRDLEEEMQHHLALKAQALGADGMPEEEAHFAAQREFGNTLLLRKRGHDMWGWNSIEQIGQDLRYGLRTLANNPGFTIVATLTLALGIGANMAIFQLLNAIRLRSLPVENPQELVGLELADETGKRGDQASWYPALTNPLWEEIRDHQQVFSRVFAWATDDFPLTSAGEAHSARGLWVSGDFFRVLGVQPILGRVFTAADDHRGCGLQGAVVSYSFWQRELGGDKAAIGRRISIDYHPTEIIGVTPAGFFGMEVGHPYDVALPVCSVAVLGGESNFLDAGTIWVLTVMGRLKSGSTLKQAAEQLRVASPGIFEATLPKNYPSENVKDYLHFKLAVFPAANGVSWLRLQYGAPLWLLLATAGLVLLIACANLANLLLARGSARERELAVRLALGAWRSRLLRQLMVENLLLAGLGAGLAFFLGRMLSKFLVTFLSTQGSELSLNLNSDWRVLGFAAGVAIFTCLLFGLTPALRATAIAPSEAMKAGSRGLTSGRERFGLRRSLVATQVALSLALVIVALLFSRSLANLVNSSPGLRQNGILVAQFDLSRLKLPVERRQAYKRELLDRLKTIPGVSSAAEASLIPLSGSAIDNAVWNEGSDRAHGIEADFNKISKDYFRTFGIPLIAGRDFDNRDTPTAPRVAIVNQAFVRQLGLGSDAVGKRFRREATPSESEAVIEIVGVVRDSKYRDIHAGYPPTAFLPTSQDSKPDAFAQILIRSDAPVADLTARLRGAIAQISPEITSDFWEFRTMIHDKLLPERLMALLSGFFGLLAGVLAAVGLYGVVSYTVERRRNEIGIRMALGAGQRDVLWMVFRETLWLVLAGIAFGLPCAMAGARLAGSLLYGLEPYDPATMSLATLMILAVSALAGYLPARRATKVDPMVALRCE
jgi:putative ABC transport system permease protein